MSRLASTAQRTLPRLAMLNALWFASCASCRDAGFVAELITKKSSVERELGRIPGVWSTAQPGDRFELGDGLRTGALAEATLALPRSARLLVKSDTVVHFKRSLDGAAPSERLEVQQGELTIETGALDLGVSTARGVVKLTPGTRVRMRAEPEKTHFDVVVGRVDYTREGTVQSVQTGSGFDVEVLKASVEEAPIPFATTTPTSAELQENTKAGSEKSAADSSMAALSRLSFQEPPPRAIVTLPAGESAIIHDPKPPTDVRVTLTNNCPELAVLELDRGNGRFDVLRARGTGEVRARVPRGSFKYRLRCARAGRLETSAVSSGRLTVVVDGALRPLPRAPATIIADADGRRYTVSYQNRLPTITLRWPDAPRANAYRVFVRPDKGTQFSTESSRTSVTLEPGRVGEGLHQFWFETPDKQRSEQGQLQVSFDYAARTAYLTSPLEGDRTQNGRTRFAGGTLVGSSVHVNGAAVKLDAQGRFASTVDVPAGAEGACVRVQHPSTGIHYYVRHLR